MLTVPVPVELWLYGRPTIREVLRLADGAPVGPRLRAFVSEHPGLVADRLEAWLEVDGAVWAQDRVLDQAARHELSRAEKVVVQVWPASAGPASQN